MTILYVRVLNQAPQLIEICLLRYIKEMSKRNMCGKLKEKRMQKKQFLLWRLDKLVTLIEKGEPGTGSGNEKNQVRKDIKSRQETIDTWAKSMIPKSMTLWKYLILIGIMLLIVVLFFLDQFGFPHQDWSCQMGFLKWSIKISGRPTQSVIHFLLYAIPPIAAAFGGSYKLTERQYNDIMADMGDAKKAFKQSKKYRSLKGKETIADAVTIVSVFIAAITALAS